MPDLELSTLGAVIKTAYEGQANTNAFTDAQETKLAGIAAGAEVNVNADWNSVSGDSQILNKPTIPSTLDDLTETATRKHFTDAEKTKLSGITSGATVNATDAQLRDRTTHTGTQAISTVSGLQTALDLKLESASIANFETTAQLNSRDTANRNRSNHSGTQLASTISDFAATVLAGVLTGLSLASSSVISATDTVLSALGKLQAQITSLTPSSVGLGNVDNTSDLNKPVSNAVQAALDTKIGNDQSIINALIFG